MNKFVLLCLLFSTMTFAQNNYTVTGKAFSLQVPEQWFIAAEDFDYKGNIKEFDWNDKQKDALERQKKLANVAAFYKYDRARYRGVIPTVNITLASNPAKNSSQFMQIIENKHKRLKDVFDNYKVLEQPHEIMVDGCKAVLTSSSFSLKGPDGVVFMVGKMLSIPFGRSYYSISLVEEQGKEDNAVIFDSLIKTIKFNGE